MRISALVLLLLVTFSHGVTVQPKTDKPPGKERLTLKHSGLNGVAFSPDGKRLASASDDGAVKVWDTSTGENVFTLKGHSEPVQSVAFSPDGKRLASASNDQTVKVWDAKTGKDVLTLKGHSEPIQCVAFSPDGKRLASASDDKTVKVWDAKTGKEVLTLNGHTKIVLCVTFSPDGKRLASGGEVGQIKLWNAETGNSVLTLAGHEYYVADLAFSRDGKRLASASWDNTIKVWDVARGRELLTLKGHVDNVYAVDFHSDGKRLASASRDGWVKVWDTATGQNLHTLTGRKAYYATDVVFSPDGKQLASAGNAVRLWDFVRPTPVTTNAPSAILSKSRTWTDATGQFKSKAKFIRIDGTFVVLARDDKTEFRVPLDRLSKSDIALLNREIGLPEKYAGTSTPKGTNTEKPKNNPPSATSTTTDPRPRKVTGKPAPRKDGVWAEAGFNSRKGMGIDGRKRNFYPLGQSNRPGGAGELGWKEPWPASANATFQTQNVFEGDGALHLAGTANYARSFAGPLTGTVEIEQHVRISAGGDLTCYVWEKNHTNCGPMWRLQGGQFVTLDGDERGSGKWSSTDVSAPEDEWIKVVIEIDSVKRRWKLKLPANDYVSADLKYRGAPKQFLQLNYLSETPAGVFIDAIKIRQAKSK